MTFTCPYGTFAYKRMPLRLCNAYVLEVYVTIFDDLIKKNIMEVLMDNFFVFDDSINLCLHNLEQALKFYEETNLVLN